MPGKETLNIALTREQADMLRDAVASGEFASESDALHDAIEAWREKRQADGADRRRLRALWDEGKASGRAEPIDFLELRKEARRRLKDASGHGG